MSSKKKFVNPIDPEKVMENPGLSEIAHHVGSAPIKPVDRGKLKGKAMVAMTEQTDMQLQQIYEQIQTLAGQAKKIQQRKDISASIYNAEMRFEPLIGKRYFLYEKEGGKHVLSMVKPSEWGKRMPYAAFISEVSLLADYTWYIHEEETTE